MTVKRLRPLPSPEQLAAMYATPHDHRLYGRGHHERVENTIAMGQRLPVEQRRSIGDLSCGNGEIARRLGPEGGELHLGDLAVLDADLAPDQEKYCGPIEETIHLMPGVDLYVCSETIEHLDRPATVLAAIRSKAARLLLSTPIDCWGDGNGEHLWAWSRQGVEQMAFRSGWEPLGYANVDSTAWGEPYNYGIWLFR